METKKTSGTKENPLMIHVMRHGKTMLNTTNRVQGWCDSWLTPAGEEDVRHAARGLKNFSFDAAYSSDSGRAIQTANIVLEENLVSGTLELCSDSRFREVNFGSFEGGLVEDMWSLMAKTKGTTLEEMNNGDFSPNWMADTVAQLDRENRSSGSNWPAEDFQTVTTRLLAGLREVAKKESEKGSKNVLIVSHGISIASLIHTLAPDYVMPQNRLENASITKISYENGQFLVLTVNELEHMEAGKKEAY